MSKKRDAMRSIARISAEIVDDQGRCVHGTVRDVSVKGVYIACPEALKPNGEYQLRLVLADPDLSIRAIAQVVRTDAGGAAFEFVEMSARSLIHLRNLVLYNSTDPDRVARELRGELS
jgi:hypothetical protein